MTAVLDIANRALQVLGTRTTVSAGELAGNTSNEAIQVNLVLYNTLFRLLRMAPWDCATKTANLVYITSTPGTPENPAAPTTLWQPGQPPPPWAYEYQYPYDCIRAVSVIPATQTGFASGIPITTAVTGGAPSFWLGPPVKFKVQTESLYTVSSATVAAPGSGHVPGEVITLPSYSKDYPGSSPMGTPAQLAVQTTDAYGGVATVLPVQQIYGGANKGGGSYFYGYPNPVPQGSSNVGGVGASFNVVYNGPFQQRVVLCNQEFATLNYVCRITDPELMDDQLQEAWAHILGARVVMALTGDKKLANYSVGLGNQIIETARTGDANEGLTINDITPDFVRVRGVDFPEPYSGPFGGFEWGSMWPIFG